MLPYELSFIAACLTIFFNYIIGKPANEFSPYEIFSSYTVWLAKRRLNSFGLLKTYEQDFRENLIGKKPYEIIEMKSDFKRLLYHSADPYFTWERAVGMCPVCTGFWISLITGLIFYHNFPQWQDFFELTKIVVFSHVLIRLLSKLL
jgi:hypothetical protein